MSFSLLWNDEDVENASKDFSFQVARDMEAALEDKSRQIKWCKNMSQISKRFHKVFNLDSLTVAEIRFSSMSGEYRAICVVVPEEEVVVYHSLVSKKGSEQEKQLKLLEENADVIEESIRKNIL